MTWVLKEALQGKTVGGADVVVATIWKLDADGFHVDEQGNPYEERKLKHYRSESPDKAPDTAGLYPADTKRVKQTIADWLANADREIAAMIAQLNAEEEALV